MNEFRILSIDEFDALFVKDLRIKKVEIPKTDSGLIPEFKITDKATDTASEEAAATDSAATATESVYASDEKRDDEAKAESANTVSAVIPEEKTFPVFSDEETAEDSADNEPEKKKKSGAFAGKIVSIVMLSITAVVFLLGCFVSVFLDNNGLDIGGICFSTQSRDIIIGEDKIGEGALVISKKLSPEEYSENLNKPVAVRADKNASSGCDIMFLYSVTDSYVSGTELEVYDPMTNEVVANTYLSSECSGIVQRYIPAVGGILTFAINNAVLVCALFVLLAAFWCLLLVLFEKNNKRKE